MALSNEDRKDVKREMGSSIAKKVSRVTRDKVIKKMGNKSNEIRRDATGSPLLHTVREQKYSGYRNMSSSSRHNARLDRTFNNAMEDRRDPVHKSFNRHYRKSS